MSPADKKQRMDRFFAAHRESGLPVTTQRRAVFEVILDRTDHPTSEQLYRAVSTTTFISAVAAPAAKSPALAIAGRTLGGIGRRRRHLEINTSYNERNKYYDWSYQVPGNGQHTHTSCRRRPDEPRLVAEPVEARYPPPSFLQVQSDGRGLQLRERVQKPRL